MPFFLTDGSDIEGVHRARDVKHVRELGRMLGVFGAWPIQGADGRGGGRRRWFFLALAGLTMVLMLASLYFHAGEDMLQFGHTIITVLLDSVTLTKAFLFFSKKYWRLIDMFLDDIHLFNHKHRNEHFHKVHSVVHARCHLMWRVMSVVLMVGVLLFNARPLYVNVSRGVYVGADYDYEYSIYFEIPHWNLRRQFTPHIVCSVMNLPICASCVGIIWMPDLLSMQVVMHIWGHMRILGHEMKNFSKEMEAVANDKSQFNKQESKSVREKLKYFIDSHHKILSYMKTINVAFSEVYFYYFLFFQVTLCIMMWECSQGTEGLVQYGVLTVSSVFSLSLLCVIMEMIATENDALVQEVYCLPWHLMRSRERRTILFMLMRVQLPLRMKALGFTDIGVSTMATILRTSISYFMLLRSEE